ncbi:recombinase family protein [Streptomyces sp. SKN60]|uniref:recombinase family protein n=1 Tax=Streptomyces sp. SKN60 TaxID=2855506 RepID=UPI0022462708|nr:recombinase family protein [Streptomyces sp. SKN60]
MPAEQLDTVRVAVYARQSKERPDSSEASPDGQVAAGASLAASRGWKVVHAFKDVGRSGWDPNAVASSPYSNRSSTPRTRSASRSSR